MGNILNVNGALYLLPSSIYFSRGEIGNMFENNCIGHTLDDLCEGRLKPENIPIRVRKICGRWFTYDNRLLWVFLQAERLGKCHRVPVIVSNNPITLTTQCDGLIVTVRGDPGGVWHNKNSDWIRLLPPFCALLTGVLLALIILKGWRRLRGLATAAAAAAGATF